MRLIDNPFKLLDVTPSDNVNIINQNAEDKAFMDDENERLYEDARTTLLSPTKRIAAEVGWIYDRNIDSVINDINNGIVNLNNCDCLEEVNFLIEVLYKCELNKLFSVFVSLDQCYRESSDSSHIPATTPKSCVIKTIDVPIFFCISLIIVADFSLY